MPSGLQVFNNDGYFQITDSFKNIVFLNKGTGNLDGTTNWTGGNPSAIGSGSRFFLQVPNTHGYPPLLALRCNDPIMIYRTVLNGANWEFDILSEHGYSRTTQIEWYTFGPPANTSPANFGLEVRNAAGQITYHSSHKPLIVRDIKGTDYGSGTTFDIGSGRKLALIIMSEVRWASPQVPAGTWQQFVGATGIQTSTSSLHTGNLNNSLRYSSLARAANYGWGGYSNGKYAVMAVDVTNL